MTRILVFRQGSIGDTVMALPCFHAIRERFPSADITLLTNRPVAANAAPVEAVLGNGYFFDRVLHYPPATRNVAVMLRLIRQIRTLRIDTVIDLTASRSRFAVQRDKLFFKAAGARHLLGFPTDAADYALAHDPATDTWEWEAERLSRRMAGLGRPVLHEARFWDLKLSAEERSAAQILLKSLPTHQPLAVMCVGTKAPAKDWGAANWGALLAQCRSVLPGWTLAFIGADEERALADRCLEQWGGAGYNFCGRTSPRVSAALLQRASLFVGHDSGPMHLAGAVGTPSVAIFSARNLPRQWFPRGEHNQILYHRTECAGCGLVVCTVHGKKCILSIRVEDVLSAMANITSTVQAV